ncbi:EF-hand calcium-binding domain-containing protein 6 isoform X1 [Peromyscus eremicus]|uniref:EF-hand calcium-binding domain-containing protein 6 isoform X1 n=1 Tax=Peromyscus eremicus TaxID=42410 RepID=UPI0027DBCA0D|nr:EF-hand calcium-binding domain-containing protein 6 isoform X1 [Peromyscus eremicus]
MKRNNVKLNVAKVNSTRSSSTKARDLLRKMAILPDWHTLYPSTQKMTYSRPHSSPCRTHSRTAFQDVCRPSSSATAIANPILSSLDVERILSQRISCKRDEIKKVFQVLDPTHSQAVTKGDLKRIITAFLLPLTREQFQDLLAQLPLTSSGNVPYLEFLSRFGGIDLNINVIRRGNGNEIDHNRTLKELETQLADKIFRNMRTIKKAFQLIDVNNTGMMQSQELRRVLETFCLKMRDEEYQMLLKQYSLDGSATVDYNTFLKNLNVSNDMNFRYLLSNPELSRESQQAKNARRERLFNSESSEDVWKNYSLDDLEKTFCQELSKCYEKIEKALSAGDPSKGGYVSLNYLKVVLDTFVYRLPRRIFIQLMKRFGLKTTTKVNWKQFLTTFYERQGLDVIKATSLKKRSSTDSRNQSRKENIIKKLFKYSEERYTALKKALLIINTTPNGHITWEELRHILNCVVAKLSDSEFNELKQTFDPECTGSLKVSCLLDALDDSPKVRKMSPPTDTKAPVPVAWDSVEEMLRDAITRNLQTFYGMLQSYDLGDTGTIARNNFKKVIHVFCPYLSNEHIIKLSSKFQDTASGRILYKKLLLTIGVDVPPPTSPPSVPKDQPNEQLPKEEQIQPDLPERTQPTRDKMIETKKMTKEEVIDRLKHCIQQQDPVFKKQFLSISKEPDTKISLEGFRKVLEEIGLPMNDNQFAQLTAKIGYKKEGMSYQDFTSGFEDTKLSGLETVPLQPRTTSKTKLDDHFISAEECLRLFPKKQKELFSDPYSAFFKIDTDRDGIINMHDLHRLLQQLQLNMKDSEFERFLCLLGLRLSVTLNFREFQNLCENRPWKADEAPQRQIRYKQKVADSELACEQAHQYLIVKAKTRWADLSKNFIETDNDGNGILRRRDIKNALYGFDIPLTPREFEKLWQSYDTEGRGCITYQEFLQRLGIRYSAKVHRPYKEDYFNFLGHFTKPKQVQEEIQELQQMTEREKLLDRYEEISKALNVLDKSKTPAPLCKVQKVLQECGCPLKEEELVSLLKSLGISVHNSCVNPLDLLRALEIHRTSKAQPKEKDESTPVNFSKLNPEEVVKNMQAIVDSSQPALVKAFSALDKENTGFVKAMEFGDVLKSFCQKLTDNQYHYLLRKLRLHLTPSIHWKYFLENFGSFLEETADEWAENMPKVPPPTLPKETANRDILARMHKAVSSHYHTIVQEFENFDTAKNNTVSRDEFRSICTRHVQILTDEQFDRLWSEMPVNTKGRLKYQDFLSRFGTERAPSPPMAAGDSGDSTVAQRGSSAPEVSQGTRSTLCSPSRDSRSASKSRSHPCTPVGTQPLQNCEPIESKLRKQIQGCWRELLKECKEKDIDKQGSVTATEFLALVEKFKLDISKEESQQLIVKYDLKGNGKFAYCDFIQSCVLLLKAKETSLMRRMRIQNADKMKEAGVETPSFYSALLRIQPKIVHCWRPMRRTFKAYDENGTGLLSVADFRKVLRQYSINLSEEEFFHVLEYYDKSLSSKISYNDFLRAFLQ